MLVQTIWFLFSLNSAFAESTASDQYRANLEIEQAYTDASGGSYILFKFQSPYEVPGKPFTPNPKFMANKRTFYCKAQRCDQLGENGMSTSPDGLSLSFQTGEGARGKLEIDKTTGKYEAKCDDGEPVPLKPMLYDRMKTLEKSFKGGLTILDSLPDVRRTAFAFKSGPDNYIYVDTSASNYSTDSYNVYLGAKGALKQAPVKNVSVMRDGGSTTITLADGRTIFSPSPLKQDAQPSLDSQLLEKLSPEEAAAMAPKKKALIANNIAVPCEAKGASANREPAVPSIGGRTKMQR